MSRNKYSSFRTAERVWKTLFKANVTVLLLVLMKNVNISRLNRIGRQLQPVELAAGELAVNWQTTSAWSKKETFRLIMPQDVSITSFSISQFLWPCARAHRSTALGCRYSRATWSILPLTRIITFGNQSPGEGVTPYNRLYGKARQRKGCHFQASGVWRCTVRISPVYLNYKRVGKSVNSVCKKAQKC